MTHGTSFLGETKVKRNYRLILMALTAVYTGFVITPVTYAVATWTGAGDGLNWSDAANWSDDGSGNGFGLPPGLTATDDDRPLINNSVDPTPNVNVSNAYLFINRLAVRDDGVLTINPGANLVFDDNTDGITLGEGGSTGTIHQNGGAANAITRMAIGRTNASDRGIYNLNAGTLTAGSVIVNGQSEFNINGGTLDVINDVLLGEWNFSGHDNLYHVSGSTASINISGDFVLASRPTPNDATVRLTFDSSGIAVTNIGGELRILSSANNHLVNLEIDFGDFMANPGDEIVLFDYDTWNGQIFENIIFLKAGTSADVNYTGGDGTQVTLTNIVIPEPRSVILLGAGSILLVSRRCQMFTCHH